MKYSDPKLGDCLASAYVLGTLAAGARRRFEQLRSSRIDIDLAATRWEARLSSLAQSVPAVRPSARVWRAIDARIRKSRPIAVHGRPAWLRLTGFGLGGLTAGVIATSALFVTAPTLFLSSDQVAMRSGEMLPQSYVGLLSDHQGDGKLLVSSLRHGRVMTMKVIGPITLPSTGKLVLWAVPADAPPFELGTVPASGSATSRLPNTSEKLLAPVRKLLVTLESKDNPSAPGLVVFSGNCAKLW